VSYTYSGRIYDAFGKKSDVWKVPYVCVLNKREYVSWACVAGVGGGDGGGGGVGGGGVGGGKGGGGDA